MSEINVNGYIIREELKSDNAGNSSWGAAYKDGKKYFIKQLKETYTEIAFELASPFEKEIILASRVFEERMNRLCELIRKSDNGNLVVPLDFIKFEGRYYLVTEWIDQFHEFSQIKKFTDYQKHLMMKVLAYSLCGLSENNIVHCDLKPDNIRIKETISDAKTLKIIDFDNGFITGMYPDMLGGTPDYMSPEVVIRVNQDEDKCEEKIGITHKADIFSLGIIFHEILTGNPPKSSDSEYPHIGIALINGKRVILDKNLAHEYKELIEWMTNIEPDDRPNALEVFNTLKRINPLHI